jgi:hypothetical protein
MLEQMIARLKGWQEKLLSLGGKEILLKTIIQTISVFAMGAFKLSNNLQGN